MNDDDKAKLLAIKAYAEKHIIDARNGVASEIAGDDPGFVLWMGDCRFVLSIEDQGHHRGHVRHMSMSVKGDVIFNKQYGDLFYNAGEVLGFERFSGDVHIWNEISPRYGTVVNLIQAIKGTRGN